tara:strand:- start:1152 stop:1382 length:231 start_codon:yes stop_codon:yes gene_type:complete
MNNTYHYKRDFEFVPEMLIVAFPFFLIVLFCCCLAVNNVKNWCTKKQNNLVEEIRIDEAIRTYSISSNESITSVSI